MPTEVADKLAERTARKVASNLAWLEDVYAQDSDRATSEITTMISTEYAPLLEVLREALKHSHHIPTCWSNVSAKPSPLAEAECNCWVSRARKLLETSNE